MDYLFHLSNRLFLLGLPADPPNHLGKIGQTLLALERCDVPRQREIALRVMERALLRDDELSIQLAQRRVVEPGITQATAPGVEVEATPVPRRAFRGRDATPPMALMSSGSGAAVDTARLMICNRPGRPPASSMRSPT